MEEYLCKLCKKALPHIKEKEQMTQTVKECLVYYNMKHNTLICRNCYQSCKKIVIIDEDLYETCKKNKK